MAARFRNTNESATAGAGWRDNVTCAHRRPWLSMTRGGAVPQTKQSPVPVILPKQ
ncbi:hypothetical protein GCM10009105_29130 [Dokdonella soli]|uniref:Uncharacterized protein n=1 Tax=Dokdonella soli TaxID=529810 RepID=A0ABN1IS56_9GAMM